MLRRLNIQLICAAHIRTCAVAVIVVTTLIACTAGPKPFAGERETNALRAEVAGKKDLITISSLRIAPLTTARGLSLDAADMQRFYKTLSDAFTSEAGIDVYSDLPSAKSKTAGQADATLHTEITRYVKDQGSALGTAHAALFALSFSLVRRSDQKEIWHSNYFSTEQPESYNLIEVAKRIHRDEGTRLPSIEELEVEAAHSAAIDFATRRVEQYTLK